MTAHQPPLWSDSCEPSAAPPDRQLIWLPDYGRPAGRPNGLDPDRNIDDLEPGDLL